MQPSFLPASQRQLFVATMMLGNSLRRTSDMLVVLQLLRALPLDLPRLMLFEAKHYIVLRRYRDARRILEEADGRFVPAAEIKALMAVTLFAQSDPLWEAYRREARELAPHPDADACLALIDAALKPASAVDIGSAGEAAIQASSALFTDVPSYGIAC